MIIDRVTNMAEQQKEFVAQDSLVLRLKNFLFYLVMLKMNGILQPWLYLRDIHKLDSTKDHKWSSSPWMHKMI